jgi:DNA invertase Pin-like site-specific DNA recombinase
VQEAAQRVIGYLRVSTTEQKDEGISLDVQRERVLAYCKMFQHELVAIYADDHTGRNMERPGFQAALARMVETDSLLMAVSLDRISRSVGDWTYLLDTYFGKGGRYRLLAFDCAGMDPRTATGRMLLMMRAVMAQGEIDSTSERTQVAMNHLKAQGVACGGLPYGKVYSKQLDEHGRRIVVEVPEQMATLQRIRDLHREGKGIKTITDQLEREKRPSPRGKGWNRALVRRILQREGLISIRHFDRTGAVRDTDVVAKRIGELRGKHLSYSEIGAQLTRENLMPPVGSKWHAQTVARTWEAAATYDPHKTIEIAVGLYRANYSLRKIGEELTRRGLTPQRGGAWHAAQVRQLLLMAKIRDAG